MEGTVLMLLKQLGKRNELPVWFWHAEANLCLHHIFTQILASKEQTDSLLNYRQYGHEDMRKYINCYLLRAKDMAAKQPARKRRNLKTFTAPKVTVFKQKKEIMCLTPFQIQKCF
jgi:hypothetical protein